MFIGANIFEKEGNTRLLVASAFLVEWEYGNKIARIGERSVGSVLFRFCARTDEEVERS